MDYRISTFCDKTLCFRRFLIEYVLEALLVPNMAFRRTKSQGAMLKVQARYGAGLVGGTALLAAVVAVVVVATNAFGDDSAKSVAADPSPSPSSTAATTSSASPVTGVTSAPGRRTIARPRPSATHPTSTSHSAAPPSRRIVAPRQTVSPRQTVAPRQSVAPRPAVPRTSAKATPAPAVPPAPARVYTAATVTLQAGIANNVFNLLNAERAANHLGRLTRSAALNASAHTHNLAMVRTRTFAHQVAGEASLGPRISAVGVRWTWAGENIASSSVTSNAGALSLEAQMYNEKAPNNGHRLNILTTKGTIVGIDVVTDSTGKMWITEDFAN
jgi:uncharacterized protein YkwD